MSYSRWGGRGSGYWYTYWHVYSFDEKENRNNAIFDICAVANFSAKQLRNNMDDCISKVASIDSLADKEKLDELRIYMKEFLQDVDETYPLTDNNGINSDKKC